MVRISETKGIPIICIKDESRVGYIESPVFDDDGYVLGFLADIKGVLFGKRFIPLDEILKIDGRSCSIYSERSIKKKRTARGGKSVCRQGRYLGKRAVLCGGEGLGVVSDLLFNAETGEIEGVELSRGIFEDIARGRRALLLRDCVEVGEDSIIVGNEGNLI